MQKTLIFFLLIILQISQLIKEWNCKYNALRIENFWNVKSALIVHLVKKNINKRFLYAIKSTSTQSFHWDLGDRHYYVLFDWNNETNINLANV